jgi:hypothetical protein
MDSQVTTAALLLMAQRDLNNVCINGTKTMAAGAVAHAANAGYDTKRQPRATTFFSVCGDLEGRLNFSGYGIPPGPPDKPETLDFGVMSHLQKLVDCGGVLGCYMATDIRQLIQSKPEGDWGHFHQLLEGDSSLQHAFWGEGTRIADPWYPAQRCWPYSSANALYYVAINASMANAASEVLYGGISTAAPLLEGTLKLSQRIYACDSTVLLHLRQTPSVAACVARKLQPYMLGTCPRMWLLALGGYEQYTCTHHVATSALPTFSGILDVAKNSRTEAFMGVLPDQTYDDMMAIYTGALGAVFGAVAAAIAAVVAAAVAGFIAGLFCG